MSNSLKEFENGIKPGTKPNYYKEFGKFKINTRVLPRNTLIIKYKNSFAPVPKLKQMQISNSLRVILGNLLNLKPNIDSLYYSLLSLKEKAMLDMMIKKAGIKTQIANYEDIAENLEDLLRKRYEVIRGEMTAGNNNDLLLVEAKELLTAMNYVELITNATYKEMMAEFE